MTAREDLLAMAGRVEGATGPDREIACLIHEWLNPELTPEKRVMYYGEPTLEYALSDGVWTGKKADFTSSLDAAMTLAEGLEQFGGVAGMLREAMDRLWRARFYGPFASPPDTAATYGQALARFFVAACLRAHAASVGRNAERHDPEEGRGPKDEHAVPEGQTTTPSRSSTIARKG
jgi:hypothetical protein